MSQHVKSRQTFITSTVKLTLDKNQFKNTR